MHTTKFSHEFIPGDLVTLKSMICNGASLESMPAMEVRGVEYSEFDSNAETGAVSNVYYWLRFFDIPGYWAHRIEFSVGTMLATGEIKLSEGELAPLPDKARAILFSPEKTS